MTYAQGEERAAEPSSWRGAEWPPRNQFAGARQVFGGGLSRISGDTAGVSPPSATASPLRVETRNDSSHRPTSGRLRSTM